MSRFKQENSTTRRSKTTWQRWLPVVAGIVLLGFFGTIFWSSQGYSNQTILAEYFQKLPVELKKETIETIPETDDNYLVTQWQLANFHFSNNAFTKANEAFDIVLKNSENENYSRNEIDFGAAKWNQILTLIGKQERTTAIAELDKIIQGEGLENYKSKAEELKKKLNSFWYGWAN